MGQDTYKGYGFEVEDNLAPKAVISPSAVRTVLSSVVKLDGQSSVDVDGDVEGITSYSWSFARVPVGSEVEGSGFEDIDGDNAVVSFVPDKTGIYEVSLQVSDGTVWSEPVIASVEVGQSLVPNNEGIVPDAGFIWNYLPDFWSYLDGREKMESLWSGALQVVGSELLKLYQIDYNKSIRDIQSLFQRRWLSYESGIDLDASKAKAILADDQAGISATTVVLDSDSRAPKVTQPDYATRVGVSLTEGDFVQSAFGKDIADGRVIKVGDRSFTMIRSRNGRQALTEGEDGATSAGTNTFTGSGFETEHEGELLRVLEGDDKGTYTIDAVTTSASIEVVNDQGDPVSFKSSASGLSYVVLPVENNISSFFADRTSVPAGLIGLPWRFSSTFSTSEFDLEEQGAEPGDLLEVEIERLDINRSARLRLHVTGVDRDRISFVFNRDDLEDGVPANGISEEDQEQLAEELQVTGLSRDLDNKLQYELEAAAIKKMITSKAFKRTYFETSLTYATTIDVGPFEVRIKPVKLIRNSRMRVDDLVTSVPMLQEYIREPELAEKDGDLHIIGRDGKLYPIDHVPYVLIENQDYVLDDASTIRGTANLTINNPEIELPYADLLDRRVKPGDTLVIKEGISEQVYDIRQVLSPEKVLVSPTPSDTISGATYRLSRRVGGKFLRFVDGQFSKDLPAPERLWAEVTYISNNPNIEDNFGVLVGITEEDLTKRNIQAPYRSVVAGLMYALTTGPAPRNIRLGAHILNGLPFAEHAGVVVDINPEFRKRLDGSPQFGRIVIEAQTDDGEPLGITDIYEYPLGRQIEDPDNLGEWISATPNEAGLGINPDTEEEYKIGDSVAQFAILSKGVEILDHIDSEDWVESLIEQGNTEFIAKKYHALRLRMNSDIVAPSDVSLTADFLQKAKPHYVDLSSSLLRVTEDFVTVEDYLVFGRKVEFSANTSYGLPTALKFDKGAGDDDFISIDGHAYARYISGDDLSTTQGSNQVTSAGGGFINARSNESHDSPFLREGDLLVITSGPNEGEYPISSVVSDTDLVVTNSGVFTTKTGQLFRVFRPVENPLFSQVTVSVTQGVSTVTFPDGMFSAGVSVGDVLTLYSGGTGSRIYTIISTDIDNDQADISPSVEEASGDYTGNVWREGLVAKYLTASESDTPYTADFTAGSAEVAFVSGSSDLDKLLFVRPFDTIYHGNSAYTVLDFDPVNLKAYVTPKPGSNQSGQPVKVWRTYLPATPVDLALLDRIPGESLHLTLKLPSGGQDLETTSGSQDVTTSSGEDFSVIGVLPGDFLVVLEGADSSRDIGYGDGVFPVQELPSSTTLRLTRALTETNGSPGIRYGIQRRMST